MVCAKCEDILTYLEILEEITRSKDLQRKAWKYMMYCYSRSGNTEGLNRIASKVVNDETIDADLKYQSKLIVYKSHKDSSVSDQDKLAQLRGIYEGNDNIAFSRIG